MSHFVDKAVPVDCKTDWGLWNQTRDDINIEVHLPQKCRSKDLQIIITNKSVSCFAFNELIFEGQLFAYIHTDESIWALEEGNLIRMLLSKAKSSEVWESLMADGSYNAPPSALLEMSRHNDLESFQSEYPGMDFSRAKLQKSYDKL